MDMDWMRFMASELQELNINVPPPSDMRDKKIVELNSDEEDIEESDTDESNDKNKKYTINDVFRTGGCGYQFIVDITKAHPGPKKALIRYNSKNRQLVRTSSGSAKKHADILYSDIKEMFEGLFENAVLHSPPKSRPN